MNSPSELSPLVRTRAAIQQGLAAGLHTGAQLFATVTGRTVANLALGESRPGVPMTPDSLVLWLSSTKPVVAACVLQLVERGQLALDERVAHYLPDFAANGKEAITLRQLLTHTGGFRWVELGWPLPDWEAIIERLCRARLERGWVPGEKAGYHPFTSWYILGELVRLADGRALPQYVRQEIFEPLGMLDCWIGMPAERFADYGERLAILPDTEKPSRPSHRYSSLQGATACIPGGNGHGPLGELVVFYETLLAGGARGAVRILQPATVALMTSRQREGMYDETFKHIIDWGLGAILDSNRYGAETVPYGYGRHASDRAFGHSGSQSSVGFADPAHQLAVGCYLNGTPGEERHQPRMRSVLEALYEDLGLA